MRKKLTTKAASSSSDVASATYTKMKCLQSGSLLFLMVFENEEKYL